MTWSYSRQRLNAVMKTATRAQWLHQQAAAAVGLALASGDMALVRDAELLRRDAFIRWSDLMAAADNLARRVDIERDVELAARINQES